ncbi:MAG: hypothetical protein V3V20_03035 [Algisphaera sp.]
MTPHRFHIATVATACLAVSSVAQTSQPTPQPAWDWPKDSTQPLIQRVDLAVPGTSADADLGYFGPDPGLWEWTLSGAGESDTAFEESGANFTAEANHYLTQSLSVGVRQSVGIVERANNASWNAATSVFGQWHLGKGQLRPFIGLEAGYLYGDGVTETFFGGPEMGTRFYLRDNTFLYGRGSYSFLVTSSDDADARFDEGRLVYSFGVGFSF